MNAPILQTPSAHQIARDQIDAWRGKCIDIFARCERAVGATLIVALQVDETIKLRSMAGQRLTDLEQIAMERPGTPKQKLALKRAIELWRACEPRRAFLAHAEVFPLIDAQGVWNARFDLTRYQANRPVEERWTVSRNEARKFEGELADSFKTISTQLGQLRKRLKP